MTKVYCKDCKYGGRFEGPPYETIFCEFPSGHRSIEKNEFIGRKYQFKIIRDAMKEERNKTGNCKYYKPKPVKWYRYLMSFFTDYREAKKFIKECEESIEETLKKFPWLRKK